MTTYSGIIKTLDVLGRWIRERSHSVVLSRHSGPGVLAYGVMAIGRIIRIATEWGAEKSCIGYLGFSGGGGMRTSLFFLVYSHRWNAQKTHTTQVMNNLRSDWRPPIALKW